MFWPRVCLEDHHQAVVHLLTSTDGLSDVDKGQIVERSGLGANGSRSHLDNGNICTKMPWISSSEDVHFVSINNIVS